MSASGPTPLPAGMPALHMPRKGAVTRITRLKSPARTTPHGSLGRNSWLGWARSFLFACPNCGGDIRLIAFITEPGPIRKILTHLGEPLEPPPITPARGPPADWGDLLQARDDRAIFQASPDELAVIDIHSV